MRKYKFISFILSAVMILSLFSGCAAKETAETTSTIQVSSANTAEMTTEQHDASATEYGTFETNDGVLAHLADIGSDTTAWNLLAVEVTPHEFTAADAHRIADALFGDVTYYEHQGSGVRPMTKSIIEEKLALWESFLEPGTLETLYGDQPEIISQARETIEIFIENARAAYDTAPETEERVISDWSFHPWEYYTTMTDYTPDGRVSIEIDTTCNSIPYTLSFSNYQKDFYLNSLYVYPYTGYVTPDLVEDNIFRIDHSYSAPPTDVQLESARNRAKELLDAFGLGEWEIDQCTIDERAINPGVPQYTIKVKALPVFNGVAVTRQTQLSGLRNGAADGLNWYYTDASFEFGTDNTLLFLELQSPVDIQKTEACETISSSDAAAALQASMEDKNLNYIFLTAGVSTRDLYVYQVKTGYSRVGAKDNTGRFWFVPSATALVALEDKTVFGDPLNRNDASSLYSLLTISLLDGSVIPTMIQ